MSYVTRYTKTFTSINSGRRYRIDISQSGYAGSAITIPLLSSDPVHIKSMSLSREDDNIVYGSELVCEIVLPYGTTWVDYEPLITSSYRDFIITFSDNTTDDVIWKGYLMPENITRQIFTPNTHLTLSATDGLKDLKELDFRDSGELILGRKTGLEILELAFAPLELDLDFVIKLGTRHGTQTGLTLNGSTFDCRRFSKIVSGKTEVDTCLVVVEKLLKPFNCTVKQIDGKWRIQAMHEGDTQNFPVPWSTMAPGTAVAATDTQSLTGIKFSRNAEFSMLPPYRRMGLRLLNRNLGGSLVANINDYSSLGGGWSYANYTSNFDGSFTDYMQLDAELDATPPTSNGYVTLSSNVSIQRATSGDYLKFQFAYRHMDTGVATTDMPEVTVIVIKDGVEYSEAAIRILGVWFFYESPLNDNFKLIGDVLGAAIDYNVRLEITSNDTTTTYETRFSDFDITRVVSVDGTTYSDVTFDTFFQGSFSLDRGKVIKETADIWFADSPTTGDLAAIQVGGVNTDERWKRYGVTEEQPLLKLLTQVTLNGRPEYIDFLSLDIKDEDDDIDLSKVIQWQGKEYDILSYDKTFKFSWVSVNLRQRLTTDIAVSFLPISLTSIEGEAAVTSRPVSGEVSVAWDDVTDKPATFPPASHTHIATEISDSTTVGRAFINLANPSAITFPRINAANSVSLLTAADYRTALGLGTLATKSTIVEADITNSAVTYAKIQNMTDQRILGRNAGSVGVVTELTGATVRTLTGTLEAGTDNAQIRNNLLLDGRYALLGSFNTLASLEDVNVSPNNNDFLVYDTTVPQSWRNKTPAEVRTTLALDTTYGRLAVANTWTEAQTINDATGTTVINGTGVTIDRSGIVFQSKLGSNGNVLIRANEDSARGLFIEGSTGGISIGTLTVTSGFKLDVNGKAKVVQSGNDGQVRNIHVVSALPASPEAGAIYFKLP